MFFILFYSLYSLYSGYSSETVSVARVALSSAGNTYIIYTLVNSGHSLSTNLSIRKKYKPQRTLRQDRPASEVSRSVPLSSLKVVIWLQVNEFTVSLHGIFEIINIITCGGVKFQDKKCYESVLYKFISITRG